VLLTRVVEVGEAGPVTALQAFLAGLMQATGTSRMLAPVVIEDGVVNAEVIAGGERMARVNPLLPLMHADAVAALRSSQEDAPAEAMMAVLRPCEVRAAVGLAKQGNLNLSNTVLVGVDCLSTYEPAYWERGNKLHRGCPDWLVAEALQLAQAGQVQSEGTRLACQLCDRPAADYRAADLLIGLVGVQNREQLLVLADEAKDARWNLQGLTDRPATERETADREVALWRLADRRKEAAAACLESLGLQTGSHPAAIMRYMSKCTLCGECIDTCPQWSEELRSALTHGREAFVQALLNATQRLAYCSECGMCQVECGEGIPLSAIQRSISLEVQHRMHPVAGRDARDPLPWST
jgi:formate dehydrogenase subunit beta